METATYQYDVSKFKLNIQNLLPMLNELSEKDRNSLIDYIQKIPHFGKKKLAPLDIPLFTVNYIADDFDDYLGDDFGFQKMIFCISDENGNKSTIRITR